MARQIFIFNILILIQIMYVSIILTFLVEKINGDYVIVEVKGDNKIEDPVVLAKERAARETATASRMEYKIIKGSEVMNGESNNIF